MWYAIVLAVLSGYFLGNLNGAVTMSVLHGRADIRSRGSGNAGLTNFVRSYGGKDSVVVFAIDMGKTILGCLLGGALLAPYDMALEGTMLAGMAVVLGHDYPLLLGFRGGKGITCSAFVALMADWRVFVIIIVVFLIVYLLTKYVSLASCTAAITFVAAFCVFHWGNAWIVALGILAGAMALFMHRENIKRLLNGTERKTVLGKKKE